MPRPRSTNSEPKRRPLPDWVKWTVITQQKACCKDCQWPLQRPNEVLGNAAEAKCIEYDHRPPLSDRDTIPQIGDWWPPQHHPNYIDALCTDCHKKRTFGTKATTAGSDVHRRAKTRRIHKQIAEHAERMDDKRRSRKRKPRSRWPSRKIASRANPWPKGRKFPTKRKG
jgi:hypothetical protein